MTFHQCIFMNLYYYESGIDNPAYHLILTPTNNTSYYKISILIYTNPLNIQPIIYHNPYLYSQNCNISFIMNRIAIYCCLQYLLSSTL